MVENKLLLYTSQGKLNICNEQFALFVKRGFVTPEEYKEMTGVDYDPEKAHV